MCRLPRCFVLSLLAGLAVAGTALTGCKTVHQVKIDAISDRARPVGNSYRLQARPGARADEAVMQKVLEHVRLALAANGLHTAVGGMAPDVTIVVDAGVGPPQRKYVYEATVEPQYRVGRNDRKQILVYEKYIRLSARTPLPEGRGGTPGPEVWSVHVIIEDESQEFSPYLSALTAALVDHIGEHAPEEMTVRIRAEDAKRAVEGVKGP